MKQESTQFNNLSHFLANNPIVAAPMAGITNRSYRKFLRKFTDGLIFTEMVSVEGLKREINKTVDYIKLSKSDNPIIIQLFGYNEKSFSDAIKICEDYSKPFGFDINMGCPVKKVLKTGGGSNLLKDLKQVKKIFRYARKQTDKTLTAKIRLGWDKNSYVYKDILQLAHDEGLDGLIIHARTKSDMFSGDIDYLALENAAQLSTIPIIGNGNITDLSSYKKIMETGVKAAMIGRAIMHSPWIFKAIAENKNPEFLLDSKGIYSLLMELKEYEIEERGKNYLNILKKYAVFFSKNLPNAANFRKQIYSTSDEKEVLQLIENFFCNNPG